MMLDTDIQKIIEARTDASPIWYGSVKYRVKINRKWYPFQADKIVMKGTPKQILADTMVVKRVLEKYLGGGREAKKKVNKFDLDKIVLDEVIFNMSLGYGVKC